MKKIGEFLGGLIGGSLLSLGFAYGYVMLFRDEVLSWGKGAQDVQNFMVIEKGLIGVFFLLFMFAFGSAFIMYHKLAEKIIGSANWGKKILFFLSEYLLWCGFLFFVFSLI